MRSSGRAEAVFGAGRVLVEHRSATRVRRCARAIRAGVTIASVWGLALCFALPFAWMFVSSLKHELDILAVPPAWIPHPLTWSNYHVVLASGEALTPYFGNSAIVAAFRVVGDLCTASLAGYGFARLSFPGRDQLFVAYLSVASIPYQVLLIPRFFLFRQIGLYDSLAALILPGMFTVFGTFLLRQFFLAIPGELGDAARVDGASEFQIFLRIMVPLARPALAALAVLAFVWSWNDYETPLVMLTTGAKYTVPLALTNYIDAAGAVKAGPMMAGAVVSVVPIFVLFLSMQKAIVKAFTDSALKG